MRLVGLVLVAACGAPPSRTPAPEPPPATRPVVARETETRRDVTVEMAPMSVLSTGRALVWTDQANTVWTMPAGGEPKQLSDQKHPDFAFSLFAAGTQIFATGRHGVLKVDLEAGAVTTLPVTGLPDQPEDAVADRDYLYVTIFKRDDVLRIPVTGGKAEKIASVSRGVLGIHDSTVYIASYAAGTLSVLTGTPRLIAKGLPRPTAVAADATHAFVYCERDQVLRKIDLATGVETKLAGDLINSDDVLVDGDWVYTRSWGAKGTLLRVPKAGGAVQTLADDLRSPYRIASDAGAIYVTSRDDRRIVRIPRSTLSP